MVDQSPPFSPERDASDEGESEGFDVERVRELAGFVVHAVRRRPLFALATFLTVAAVGLLVAAAMPKTYVAEVKLLAQRGSAIRILSSQNQQMDSVDNPTKNVSAMILRRDNLVALAKDTDLVSRFEATRPALLRLRDRWMAKLFGSVSDEDKLLAMVFTLEKQLEVTTDEATVSISVEWPNPRIAYDLVTLVQKNFLEARYDGDVAVINDSIGVLEDHAKTELANVDKELAEYQKIVDDRASRAAAAKAAGRAMAIATAPPRALGTTGPRPIAAAAPAAADPEITKELEQKRTRIRAIEEAQQRTLEGLKQQLLQAQLTLTPMHPTVIGLQQQIEAASQPSPELAQLRNEEHSLMDELVPPRAAPAPPAGSTPIGGSLSLTGPPFGRAPSPPDAGAEGLGLPLPLMSEEHDGQLQLAATELGSAIRAYQDVLGRIDAAKVELDITRAAYKHRYTVVTPAEVPRSPKKRSARAIGAGAVVGAALLALLLATALDLAGGVVLESWQVRRNLKLEILGELDKPS